MAGEVISLTTEKVAALQATVVRLAPTQAGRMFGLPIEELPPNDPLRQYVDAITALRAAGLSGEPIKPPEPLVSLGPRMQPY